MSPRNDYHGYPKGMSGHVTISREEFVANAKKLIELSEDWREMKDGLEVLKSMIIQLRSPTIGNSLPPPDDVKDNWATWQGGGLPTCLHGWLPCHGLFPHSVSTGDM